MKLEKEKINREKYYSAGYSPELGKYVLACVVPWVAWYNRYYEISKEEYDSFGSAEFEKLANRVVIPSVSYSPRRKKKTSKNNSDRKIQCPRVL